jgi:hypothetical protein
MWNQSAPYFTTIADRSDFAGLRSQSASALIPSLTVAPALGQKPVAQSMVFKLEGQIEADLSNLPWVSQ